ncbi:hypothetical protein Pogu_1000 [Pyrobaculum oguniense TE7]|uniref:Uncharacterized protein n=1 Tax=Pyrobaculum oguniense (strain DSM 13380 / JCM 10595 / TE7) TaxID=698757 RepID=H6Q9W9_PYROT|nr:hypothetical protein Pogu_1000 [Pyrobaculum oguniense TE7]
MDPIVKEILEIVIKETLQDAMGVTPYKIMKKRNFYPSFLYKLIRKLENSGYIKCRKGNKGRRCVPTLRGALTLYNQNTNMKSLIESYISRLLSIDINHVRKIINVLLTEKYYPIEVFELLGWCMYKIHIYECRVLLRQFARCNNMSLVVDSNCCLFKMNGQLFLECSKNCNNCIIKSCKVFVTN